MWPTIVDAVASRSNSVDGDDPEHDGDQRAGHDRRHALAGRATTTSEISADEQRQPLVSPSWPSRSHSCSKKSPSPFSTPKQLGQLPDDDRQREADDEALEHRLGDEVGEEAEPQQAGDERRRRPSTSASAAVSATNCAAAAGGEVADGRRRQRRGGRHRPDDEVPRAAEGRVEEQRRRRGVQADDRRDAGDRGVGQRLRARGPPRPSGPATRSPRSQPAGSRGAR